MQGGQGTWLCLLEVKQASNGAELPGFLHGQMELHVSFIGVLCPVYMFKGCLLIAAWHCSYTIVSAQNDNRDNCHLDV